jgi:bla regulator protein blaR1
MNVLRSLLPRSLACLTLTVTGIQSPDANDRQKVAGGKMTFAVASLKPGRATKIPDFPLDSRNAKAPGGRLSATFPLSGYIMFAYKLEPWQVTTALADVPKWVGKDLYEIEARAEGNPTKDQMRLMMQSLLGERFKLAVHFDTREVPIFALTLVKRGRLEPKLRPHAEGPPCPDPQMPSAPPQSADVFPPNCDTQQIRLNPDGMFLTGSRNSTMELLANAIRSAGFLSGEIDRPVLDRTGLQGTFDDTIAWNGQGPPSLLPPGRDNPSSDLAGTMFLQAMRKQLG